MFLLLFIFCFLLLPLSNIVFLKYIKNYKICNTTFFIHNLSYLLVLISSIFILNDAIRYSDLRLDPSVNYFNVFGNIYINFVLLIALFTWVFPILNYKNKLIKFNDVVITKNFHPTKIEKIAFICLINIFFILLASASFLPENSQYLLFKVISLFTLMFLPFIGYLLGFLITVLSFGKQKIKVFKNIKIWWIYVLALHVTAFFNKYVSESLEIFNTDRGDFLPRLPILQQNIGFYLNMLIFTIPFIIICFYLLELSN